MKITKRQLRQIIKEAREDEGFENWVVSVTQKVLEDRYYNDPPRDAKESMELVTRAALKGDPDLKDLQPYIDSLRNLYTSNEDQEEAGVGKAEHGRIDPSSGPGYKLGYTIFWQYIMDHTVVESVGGSKSTTKLQLRRLIRKELNEIKALKKLFSRSPSSNKITVKNPEPGGSDLELPEEVYAAISEMNPALANAIDAVNAGTPRSTDRYKVRGQWPRLVKFSTMEPVEIKSLFGSLDVDYMIAQIKDKSEIMDWNIHKQEGPLGRQHNIMLVKRPTQEQMKFGVVDPFWAFDNAGISDPKARGSVWVPKRFSQKFEHTRGQWTGPLYAYVWSSGDRQYGKGGYTWHILDNNNTNLMILTSRGEWASPAAAVKSMKREFFDKFETHLR